MGGKRRLPGCLLSRLSTLRGGDRADAENILIDWFLLMCGLELHSRAIVGSAKVRWVLDIRQDRYLEERFLSELDSRLRFVNAIQTSLNDWLESGRPTLLYSLGQAFWLRVREDPPAEPSEASAPSYAVLVSALVLLSLVYQYLTGNVDRGGSRAYSRSSLDFRDVYVAIVLFLGAYVWIKFREAAPKGFYSRTVVDKHGGTRKVYEARLKPPVWNGKKVPRLDLGRFATEQDARNMFLIAAFYYNPRPSEECRLDGWFPIPSMSEEEKSLDGLEKRKWVIDRAKEVYEDFKKKAHALAALERELLEACQGQATPRHDEVNVDPCGVSWSNSNGYQQSNLASQVENSGMGMDMVGSRHGLECASHSFDGTHEGLALSNGPNLGSQEGSTRLVSQLSPNNASGMNLNVSDQLDSLQATVRTLQQQVSDQQQQIQESATQILQLQHQLLQESRIQTPQWSCQFGLQEQYVEFVNRGIPGFQMEMAQSMHQHNFPDLIALAPDGGEVQEALCEMDTLWEMQHNLAGSAVSFNSSIQVLHGNVVHFTH